MTLQDKLAALRREKGLSQENVADALDVSRQAVSKWETGLSNPSTENLIALAKLFGSSADELLELAQSPKPGEAPDEADGPAPDDAAQEDPDAGAAETAAGPDTAAVSAAPVPKTPLQKLWVGIRYVLAAAAVAAFAIAIYCFVTGTWRHDSQEPPAPTFTLSAEPSAEPSMSVSAPADEPQSAGGAFVDQTYAVYRAYLTLQAQDATPQAVLKARETLFAGLENLDWKTYAAYDPQGGDNAAIQLCAWLSRQQTLSAAEIRGLLCGGAGRSNLDGAYAEAYDRALAQALVNYPQTFCVELAAANLMEVERTVVISGTAFGAAENAEAYDAACAALDTCTFSAGSGALSIEDRLRAQLQQQHSGVYGTVEPAASEEVTPQPSQLS